MLLIQLLIEALYVLNESCEFVLIVAGDTVLLCKLLGVVKNFALFAELVLMLMRLSEVLNNLAHPWRQGKVDVLFLFLLFYLWRVKISLGVRAHTLIKVMLMPFPKLLSFESRFSQRVGPFTHIFPFDFKKLFLR